MSKYESKLPETCYGVDKTSRELIIIKRNEMGYYKTAWAPFDSVKEAQAIANEYNGKMGVTRAQAAAMSIGSMFGWDVPGADPDSPINQKYNNL